MKLIKRILTLGLGLGLVGGALASVSSSKVEAKATEYESYIPMEAAFFTNWTDAAGSFAGANATFWGENYHFQNLDTFYRGETGEGWTGTLTSRTWKQHTQYIYFQLGGAKNYDVTGDPVHLKIHYGTYFDVFYNDTFVENPMILRGFKIPDAAYNSLMAAGDDFDMYIEILDQQTAGYGFANFGYLHVNQTKEQVADAMRYYLNHMDLNDREWEVNKRKQILENYYLNGSLKEFFYAPVSDISDDFESNSDFLNHWYFDYQYFNGANWGLRFDKAIGHDTFRPDDNTKMPFNLTGNGFFRGWFENEDLGGFVGGDASRYRFISRPFVLSGTGLVSIKMAGTASLHVIDTETRQELVWADLLTYSTSGDQVNLATSGFNTVTMVRHVINLEAYLGRNIQLAIADVSDGGWSALYADELVTNYTSYPGFKVDAFTQTNNNGTYNCYRTDKYINSKVYNNESNPNGLKYVLESEINKANDNEIINHVDNSPAKDAYNFLQNYYAELRAPGNEFNYAKATEETRANLVAAFNALSPAAQAIVNASTDITYPVAYDADWWKNLVDTSKTLSVAFGALVESYVKYTVSFNANGGTGTMADVGDVKGTYELPTNGFTAPEGYQFAGWKVNGTGDTLLAGAEITVNADTELVAQWELIPANNFTVSFAANGGTGTMTAVVKEDGSTYALPGCGFTAPEGYQFAGWKVGDDATLREEGYEITVTEDVTVTAQWELIPVVEYTVSFAANGGTGTMTAVVKEDGQKYVLPENGFTAPEGYQFVGWKVGTDDTIRQPGYEITVTGDVVVTAQWELIPPTMYTVSFDANGGSGSMAELTKEEGTKFELPANGFTAPEDYRFVGWKVNGSGDTLAVGTEITVTGNVTLVAQWEAIPAYTVSFAANGGSGTMTSVSVQEGNVYTLPQCGFTAPEGYKFIGWKIGDEETLRQPGYQITVSADVVVTAQWELIPVVYYTVTFNANGGTGTMEAVQVKQGEQFVFPQCGFTAPEGKQFDAWLIGSVRYQPGDKLTLGGDTLIKATWVKVEEEKPEENQESEDKPEQQEEQQQDAKTQTVGILETLMAYAKKIVKWILRLINNFMEDLSA